MLRKTYMVRKDREQIQEGIKVVVKMIERKEKKEEYIEKENKRTAPAEKNESRTSCCATSQMIDTK